MQQTTAEPSQNEKFLKYIDQKPEFRTEETLNLYYRAFEDTGDEDEEQMLDFWKQTIYEYAHSVECKFGVKVDQLVKRFTLYDRIPCGLPSVMRQLKSRGVLATRDEVLAGALFENSGQ